MDVNVNVILAECEMVEGSTHLCTFVVGVGFLLAFDVDCGVCLLVCLVR